MLYHYPIGFVLADNLMIFVAHRIGTKLCEITDINLITEDTLDSAPPHTDDWYKSGYLYEP